jgi:PAS domain S-box-containing protein
MLIPSPHLTQANFLSAIVRDPLRVTADTTVREAIALMSGLRVTCTTPNGNAEGTQPQDGHLEARSSCVLVVDEQQHLIGILTERDIVRLSIETPTLRTILVQDAMTQAVVTIQESELTDIFVALNLLQRHRIRHLPVLDEQGYPIGLLTHESLRQTSRPEDLLRLRRVEEVMVTDVVTAAPTATVLETAQLMAQHRISCVVVVEESLVDAPDGGSTMPCLLPVGIVTERDLVQFQALDLDMSRCAVSTVMSTPLFAVQTQDALWSVHQLMEQHLIQRIVVTGEHGELCGIVTQTSLLQALSPLELYQLTEVLERKIVQLEAEKTALLESRTYELEQQVAERAATLQIKANQEKLLLDIATQIRNSLDLATILDTTVAEVRQVLDCDRVIIYQFQEDLNGNVIAESIRDGERSILNQTATDDCISPEWMEPYRQGRIRVVQDVQTEAMSQCHQELLLSLDIRSKVLVPLVVDEQLWGLMIASYRTQPRDWQSFEVELLQALSVQVAIALKQAMTHQALQTELMERQRTEAALRENEQRFKAIFDSTFQFIALITPDGLVLEVNQTALDFAGISLTQVINQPFRDGPWWQGNAERVAQLQQAIQQAAAGNFVRYEVEIQGQGQDTAIIDFSIQPITDETGRVVLLVPEGRDITDRKQAEIEHLRLTETQRARNLLEQILDIVLAGYWDWDIPNHTEYLSPGFKQMFGYADNELENRPETWQQLMFPEDLPGVLDQFNRHVASGGQEPFYNEVRYRHKDGSTVWVICSGKVIEWDEDGNPLRMIGCHIDISDRKRTEAENQCLRDRMEFLLSSSPAVIYSCEPGGDYGATFMSQNVTDLFGYPPEAFTSAPDFWQNHIHPDDIEQVFANLHQLTTTGQHSHQYRFRRQDGQYVWVQDEIRAVRDVYGNVTECIGYWADISDRKQAEQALQESETRFRRVFQSNAVGMIFTNFDGQISDANDCFLEMLGLTRAELEAGTINWAAMTPPEFVQQDIDAINHLRANDSISPWEKAYIHKDGHWVWVLIGVAMLSSADGSCVCMVVDISDRKNAEAQLQRTNEELVRATRLKDEFLANMSHELRTPLNAILGLSETLQDGVFGPVNPRQSKSLQTIERSGFHLLSLINDILDVAKIESGKIELDLKPAPILPLCESCLTLVKQQAIQKQIELSFQTSFNLPDLGIDERRIRQVLLNLLNNAIKFTPEGGKVTLSISLPPPRNSETSTIRFEVTDTGIGIAPEQIDRLFQPFIQIDSALNRQHQGTGLGLVLVKRIVELHGGQVNLTSELGVGSCFSFDLPFNPVENTFSSQTPSNRTTTVSLTDSCVGSHPPQILLVEDQQANIDTISDYLVAKGYQVKAAKNGEEAIALAKSEHPDVIVMDIQMPGMDGLEAMGHIRTDPSLVDTPIIALTALAMDVDRDRCLAAGANDYLSKPVRLRHLVATIQGLLNPD